MLVIAVLLLLHDLVCPSKRPVTSRHTISRLEGVYRLSDSNITFEELVSRECIILSVSLVELLFVQSESEALPTGQVSPG